uniref:Uncharacterized protein n=1 Tax=Meloidogyne incognita TaxID=6306 RepID=A0A914L4D8_MELIC
MDWKDEVKIQNEQADRLELNGIEQLSLPNFLLSQHSFLLLIRRKHITLLLDQFIEAGSPEARK